MRLTALVSVTDLLQISFPQENTGLVPLEGLVHGDVFAISEHGLFRSVYAILLSFPEFREAKVTMLWVVLYLMCY